MFAIAGSSSSSIPPSPSVEATVESLNEVARVYEESRAQKRKYEEVETFTGEEDETNVLDVSCKLFAFVASNWEERGPGNLRVNDSKDKTKSPRVVFRTSGNLRVLLNTKVWPGMVVQRPSQKSLRLTAIDSAGQIKIFLAMARPEDIAKLFVQLNNRIDLEKARPPAAIVSKLKAESGADAAAAANDISTTIKIDDDDDEVNENAGIETGAAFLKKEIDTNEAESSISPCKKIALDCADADDADTPSIVSSAAAADEDGAAEKIQTAIVVTTPTITTTGAESSNDV